MKINTPDQDYIDIEIELELFYKSAAQRAR